jgi:lauroyl/myristoyl acyltransferase
MSVPSAPTRLVSQLKLLLGWGAFYFLRWCERLLPTTALSLVLWPPAVARNLMHLRPRKLVDCWHRYPASWHPKRARFFLHQTFGLYHAERLHFWPDRLCTERWLSRCRLDGGSNLIGSQDGDRGVVLASLHYGPYETLPYWLRAHGIVTTMVRGDPAPDSLKSLTSYQYALSPPSDVPLFLNASDFAPLPRFAHIGKIIGPGRTLLVMVDVERGIQFQLPFEDRLFRMATGAIRLAQMANADLIPCLIRETGSLEFVLHFGAPVPRGYLGDSADLQLVGAHLLGEFSKVIARDPEQCRLRFLSAMSPLL